MNYNSRFSTAFAVMLVILSVISIKMAYLYGAELLLILAITIPMVIGIVLFRKIQNNDDTAGGVN